MKVRVDTPPFKRTSRKILKRVPIGVPVKQLAHPRGQLVNHRPSNSSSGTAIDSIFDRTANKLGDRNPFP